MNIYEKLFALQSEYRSMKDSYNQYGKFKYRNFESMMATLKPLLQKYKCVILVNHQPQDTSSGVYINTTVTLYDIEGSGKVSATATVMDGDKRTRNELCNAQISGGSMSYGAKYALGFLLGVSTESDPDAFEPKQTNKDIEIRNAIKNSTTITELNGLFTNLDDEFQEAYKPLFTIRKKEILDAKKKK